MKIFILLLALFCFLSCNSPQPSTGLLEIRPIDDLRAVIPLSEIADSVILIQLDNDNILAGYANPCLTDSFFFVTTSEGPLKYSNEGKFLQKIGGIGQGPMEYNSYHTVAIDTYDKRVCVYSIPEQVVVNYSYDGEFLNRIHLVGFPNEEYGPPFIIQVLNGKYYFFYLSMWGLADPYYWIVTDGNGNCIGTKQAMGQPVPERTSMERARRYGRASIPPFNNSLMYYDLFNDTIFRLTDQGVTSAFLWGKGEFRLDPSTVDVDEDMMVFTMFAETKNFLFFKWIDATFKSPLSFGFYDKKKQVFVGTKKLLDDLNTQINIPLRWGFTYSPKGNREYMIGRIDPYELPEEILQRENIDPEGNLVMVMIRLKDE
ncbi:6-bladed beta-propeller [Bacteroides sp. UBA939]|uniref:6-bladed beta-propeller n=1 Tax=Bacteroides sp. UBA939 TaxID=1946092 RepID=UPI0025C185D4|nr:6-bladed beta-propeller [Bacteroides sp. UBA939]